MFSAVKIAAVAFLVLIGVAVTGMVALRDLDRRPDYCAWCHVPAAGVTTWMSSDYTAYKHAVAAVNCQRCHKRNTPAVVKELVSVMQGKTEAPRISGMPDEVCTRCHGGFDRMAKLTAKMPRNPHDSPHGNDRCESCHQMHQPSRDQCGTSGCHDRTVLGPGWTASQP